MRGRVRGAGVLLTTLCLLPTLGMGLGYFSREITAPPRPSIQIDQVTRDGASTPVLTPCKKINGREESDLCAQWTSARAAESSAYWTMVGAIVAIFGIGGLIWNLSYTRAAVKEAGRSTDLAKDSKRPWLKLEVAERAKLSVAGIGENSYYIGITIEAHLTNFGGSPALDPSVSVLMSKPEGQYSNAAFRRRMEEKGPGLRRAAVFPGDRVDIGERVQYGIWPLDLETGEMQKLISANGIIVAISVVYGGAGFDVKFETFQMHIVAHVVDDGPPLHGKEIELHHMFPSEEVT